MGRVTAPVPADSGCVHEDESAGHPLITLPPIGRRPAEAWCWTHARWETTEGDTR